MENSDSGIKCGWLHVAAVQWRLKLRVSKGQHADIQRCSGGTIHAYLLKNNDLQLVSTECYIINFRKEQHIYYASLPSQWSIEMNSCTWQ